MSQVQMFDNESAPYSENNGYMTEDDLFKRLVQLESDKLTTAADIAQIKKDAKYDEDDNPYGIDKDQIPLIHDAAKLHAKRDFEEKKVKAKMVFAKYEELTGYSS